MDPLRISGKDLGQLALPDFCARCFWVQRRAPDGLPFQIFPGIFSSIDAYTKRVVHQYLDVNRCAPDWLSPLGPLTGYREPPHYSQFNVRDSASGMLLTGALDAIFDRADGTLLLADYKTAKFTENQDALLPIYEVQLNAYAYIAAALGWTEVSGLALIYMEPETEAQHAEPARCGRPTGFAMGFAAHVLPMTLDTGRIGRLLARARELVELGSAPTGHAGCKNCVRLDGVLSLLEA